MKAMPEAEGVRGAEDLRLCKNAIVAKRDVVGVEVRHAAAVAAAAAQDEATLIHGWRVFDPADPAAADARARDEARLKVRERWLLRKPPLAEAAEALLRELLAAEPSIKATAEERSVEECDIYVCGWAEQASQALAVPGAVDDKVRLALDTAQQVLADIDRLLSGVARRLLTPDDIQRLRHTGQRTWFDAQSRIPDAAI